MEKSQKELKDALKKLEKSAQKIVDTTGYTSEVEKIKILEELIKEQLSNENTRHSASPIR